MKIRKMTLSIPLIQGGMGVGVSLGKLAGAVAYEGAMGVISSVNAGYREPDFKMNPKEANARALTKEIQYARSKADGNGIVAMNIMVAVNFYEETVKTAVAAGIQAIISGAGLPMDLPQYVEGTEVAIAPIVSSGKAAKVICKQWDKKYGRIPDFIVIEGPGAGGHLGFKRDEVIDGTAKTVEEILPEVQSAIEEYEEKYGCSIPVFVAGGIYNGADMAKIVQFGAAGVQIGTRFIATKECDASDQYKQVMVDAKEEDIVIIQSPVGMPGRALNTKLIRNLATGTKLMPDVCNNCLKACPRGNDISYCISRALIAAVSGDLEHGLFFCGENVGRIQSIVSVHDLVSEIWEEYRENIEKKGAIA
ncbi:MAG: nitronate monooxygenase family protein [Eubacteriales bacterium]|nr:nitronate monooxygenase family protein [Eubacteriales bacterium]